VDPEVLAELQRLNAAYEERHGFRFVVFVNRRPKAAILPVLRERIDRSTEEELDTALGELVAIAEDRWRRG
jgi:2-oxo-4-hydroxy-4-carboxy-5-ureidoimidazoline decarboxylase